MYCVVLANIHEKTACLFYVTLSLNTRYVIYKRSTLPVSFTEVVLLQVTFILPEQEVLEGCETQELCAEVKVLQVR